jgi:hypothetical protein
MKVAPHFSVGYAVKRAARPVRDDRSTRMFADQVKLQTDPNVTILSSLAGRPVLHELLPH